MALSEWGEQIRRDILDLEARMYLDIRQIYEKELAAAFGTTASDPAGREYSFDEAIGLYRHVDDRGKTWIMPIQSQVPGWWGNCPKCDTPIPLPHYEMGVARKCRECGESFVPALPEGIPYNSEIERPGVTPDGD